MLPGSFLYEKEPGYFVTLDLIPSNARQECVATALSICLLPDLRSSLLRSVREVRAGTNLCWRYACFSPTSEGSVTSSQHDKTLVRRLPGLPDLLRQPCREKRMRKRNSAVIIIQVQSSKAHGKSGAAWAAPAAPRFRRPCSYCYSDPKVNTTMFRSILLNGVTSFACEYIKGLCMI